MKRAPGRDPLDPNIYHDDDCREDDVAYVIDDTSELPWRREVTTHDVSYHLGNHGVWVGSEFPDLTIFLPDKVVAKIVEAWEGRHGKV